VPNLAPTCCCETDNCACALNLYLRCVQNCRWDADLQQHVYLSECAGNCCGVIQLSTQPADKRIECSIPGLSPRSSLDTCAGLPGLWLKRPPCVDPVYGNAWYVNLHFPESLTCNGNDYDFGWLRWRKTCTPPGIWYETPHKNIRIKIEHACECDDGCAITAIGYYCYHLPCTFLVGEDWVSFDCSTDCD